MTVPSLYANSEFFGQPCAAGSGRRIVIRIPTQPSMKERICILLTAVGLAFNANAVSFVANGNDLQVVFDAPLQITATAASDSLSYGLVFEDVFTASQSFHIFSGSGTALTMPAGSTTTGGAAVGANIVPSDPDDLYVFWAFPANTALAIGQTVTIAAGTFTISNFLVGGGVLS